MRSIVATAALVVATACHDFAAEQQQCVMEGRCSDDAGTGGGGGTSAGGGSGNGGGSAMGGGAAMGGGSVGGGSAAGGGTALGGGSAVGGGSAMGGGSATGCAAANTDAGAPYLIFRSVGDTAALASGNTNPVSIVSGCATFTSPLPDRACVGDALQLSSDGGSVVDRLVFLSRRLDSTHFEVRSAGGQLPEDLAQPVGGWTLFRSYGLIYDAANGLENSNLASAVKDFDPSTFDLVTAEAIWNLAITADREASQSVAIDLAPFQTDSAHYVRLFAPSLPSEVGVTQRHSGVWDDTKARIVYALQYPLIQGRYVNQRIEGLQLKNTYAVTANDTADGVGLWGGGANMKFYVTDNIIAFGGTGSNNYATGVVFLNGSGPSTIYLVNNVIYGWPRAGFESYSPPGINLEIIAYNNTVLSNQTFGFELGSEVMDAGTTVYLRNNISSNNGTDYDTWGNVVAHASNNLSKDLTAPGDGGTVKGATVTFKDPAAGDYRLSTSDTAAKGKGADLSTDPLYPFSTDLAGDARTPPWDLGASNAVP